MTFVAIDTPKNKRGVCLIRFAGVVVIRREFRTRFRAHHTNPIVRSKVDPSEKYTVGSHFPQQQKVK